MKVITMVVPKIFSSGQMGQFGSENGAYPPNSKIFKKKICRMKGSNRYMKILLVFWEKKSFGWILSF